jgi:hypothetical protein
MSESREHASDFPDFEVDPGHWPYTFESGGSPFAVVRVSETNLLYLLNRIVALEHRVKVLEGKR